MKKSGQSQGNQEKLSKSGKNEIVLQMVLENVDITHKHFIFPYLVKGYELTMLHFAIMLTNMSLGKSGKTKTFKIMACPVMGIYVLT